MRTWLQVNPKETTVMNNLNLSKLRAKREEGKPFWSVAGMASSSDKKSGNNQSAGKKVRHNSLCVGV